MALIDLVKRRLGRRRVEPPRATLPFPNLLQIGRVNSVNGLVYKATPRNLRYFSRTPYPRKAINTIKNPIKMLEWEICPLDGIDWNSELKRQAEVVTNCFHHPNQADDFQSLIEQLLEDYLIGAGAIETQVGGDPQRPLWMYPVDGLSIQMYANWDGRSGSPRYAQTSGYGSEFGGGETALLTNDELLYLRPNPNTATPFGFGPLEIAFSAIARLLSVSEFAGNVAGNARPSIGLDFQGMSPTELNGMRTFWRNNVEGLGEVPMYASAPGPDGKAGKVEVLRFYPEGDSGLYLQYQDMLRRELACAFNISPQNMGIERDVNRNTSEVSEDRDWDQAIKPAAHDIAKALTRHCIHHRLGFSQLRFRWLSLDREDELATMEVLEKRYKTNSITPNQIADRFGEPPLDSEFADLTFVDTQIAVEAARGAKEVLDDDLPNQPTVPPVAQDDDDNSSSKSKRGAAASRRPKPKG